MHLETVSVLGSSIASVALSVASIYKLLEKKNTTIELPEELLRALLENKGTTIRRHVRIETEPSRLRNRKQTKGGEARA